jgi:hypothetical protein
VAGSSPVGSTTVSFFTRIGKFKSMRKYSFLLLALVFIPISFAFAHPGNTDSSGCHTCRTNCSSWGLSTGEYHCHNAKTTPQPVKPVKSTYGANGTGYTTPAPEYKQPEVTKITPINTVVKTATVVTPSVAQVKATSSSPVKTTPVVPAVKVEEENASWFIRFLNWFR